MDNKINVAASDELLDESLKAILGNRYQDASHLFTPEAQERRRNNREVFTLRIAAFLGVMIFFVAWADGMGLMSHGVATSAISVFTLVMGYFFGVCVSHNKGWRD